MLKDAGEKLDWLSNEDLPWLRSPEGQQWMEWLRRREAELPDYHDEGEYTPNDVDELAPFLTKEFRKRRIKHQPSNFNDPLAHDAYTSTGTYPSTFVDQIPRLAEYLRSREGSTINHMDPSYKLADLADDRYDWDQRYDRGTWDNVGALDDLRPLSMDMSQRNAELAHPYKDRRDLQPITPTYDWHSLLSDYRGYDDPEGWGTQLVDHAQRSGQVPMLGQATNDYLDNFASQYDEPRLAMAVSNNLQPYYNPQTNGYGHQPVQPGQVLARVSALDTPLYYRWVFHPEDATVDIDHNGSKHPAYVDTQRHLPADKDSQHGYAYRIHGGWRLTDYEHNPVSDPFIVATVVQAITGKDGRRQSSTGIWQFVEHDFDRLHYGQPTGKSTQGE